MKNYIQVGENLTFPAPYAVASGGGMQVGQWFGVACTTAAEGEEVVAQCCGVYDLTKVSAQAWAAGDAIYWDNTAKKTTTVSTGNLRIGVAVQAAANPSSTGRVVLEHTALIGTLKATATLNFGSIATTASADLTITVTGALAGDTVALGLPAAPTAGIVFQAFVSADDTVTVRATNVTGSSVDPASASYSVAIVR